MDPKAAVRIAAIFAVALVVASYIWASHSRYYLVVAAKFSAFKIDRKTGKTWHVSPQGERPLK